MPNDSYPPYQVCFVFEVFVDGKERAFPDVKMFLYLWFAVPSQRLFENEFVRRREDVAKAARQLLVIDKKVHAAFFWASSIAMIYCGTRGLMAQ